MHSAFFPPVPFGRVLLLASLAYLSAQGVAAQAQFPQNTLLANAASPALSAADRTTARGSVEGRILDPKGHPIAGATVTLRQGDLVVAEAATDESGHYRLTFAAGSYRLTVTSAGMSALDEGVTLTAGEVSRLDRSMSIAQTSSSVLVTASDYLAEEQSAASRIPIRPLDMPQTTTTISLDFMRDRAVESMQEALAYTPGVSAMLGEGRRDQVSIRGFSANTDQYVDGVKDDATYYRDLSNTDHIEVVEGPAAVLYGRGTSGGLVDRVTKKPRMEGTLAEFSTTQGGYGSKRAEGDVDTLLGSPQLGLRTTGAWESGGSFRHFYSLDRYAFAPTLRWSPAKGQDLTLQVERLRDERIPDRGIPSLNGRPAPVKIANYYGYAVSGGTVPADYLHNAVSDETLDWKGKMTQWNVHEVLRHAGYQTAFQNTFPAGTSNGTATRSEYNGTTAQENYFNQIEAWRHFHTPGMEHLFLGGVEYGHQKIRRTQSTGTAAAVDLYNPAQVAPTLSTTLNTFNGFIGQTVAGYFQDELSFAKKWKALVGLRFDNYRQSQHNYAPPANNVARTDNAPSPRIGVLYQPSQSSTYYASWSHTFDPSGEAMTLTAISSNNTAQLAPEKTDNYEVGSKYLLFGNRLTASTALYRLNRSDVKIPDYTADPTGATYINAGVQRTDGFEANASGHITEHWRMTGGWAWMDAYYAKNPTVSNGVVLKGKRAMMIPVNSGSLWQNYEWKSGFGVGLGAIAMNSRFAATDNTVRVPGYARLDASAYYRTRRWDLDAHIENLADTRYYESAHTNYQIMPGSPINGRLSLRLKF